MACIAFIRPPTPEEWLKAWQPDSDYNKNFKKDTMTTIEGTISNIGAFSPAENAAPGASPEGQEQGRQIPHRLCGSASVGHAAGRRLETGTNVTVKGSKTQVEGKEVIMATEITAEGKTIRVRDNEGKPQWNVDELKQGMQQQGQQQPQQR